MEVALIEILAQVLKAFELTQRISHLSIETNILVVRSEAIPRHRDSFSETEAKRIEIDEQRDKCYQLLDDSLNRLFLYVRGKQKTRLRRAERKTTKFKSGSRSKAPMPLLGNGS